MPDVTWLDQPEEHDFPAAASYLGLLADAATVAALVAGLRSATRADKKAKDILRAARLPLLPTDNAHVAADLTKIAKGHALSPILVVPRSNWHEERCTGWRICCFEPPICGWRR